MSASSHTAKVLWEEVVADYRRLCVLQRRARRAESDRLLREELPDRILAWAEQDDADGVAQARRLDEMFELEQRRLADMWCAQELMEERLRTELLPALSARINVEVRRAVEQSAPRPAPQAVPPTGASHQPARVAAGDIPSIIDLLFERERQCGARHLTA